MAPLEDKTIGTILQEAMCDLQLKWLAVLKGVSKSDLQQNLTSHSGAQRRISQFVRTTKDHFLIRQSQAFARDFPQIQTMSDHSKIHDSLCLPGNLSTPETTTRSTYLLKLHLII